MNIKQKLTYAVLGFLVGNALLLLLIFVIYNYGSATDTDFQEIKFDEAVTLIKSEKIKHIEIEQTRVKLTALDAKKYYAEIDQSDAKREAILGEAKKAGIEDVKITPTNVGNWFWLSLFNIVPLVFAIVIIGLLAAIFVRLGRNKKLE